MLDMKGTLGDPDAIVDSYLEASRIVQANWTLDPGIVCASAGRHGPVPKEAIPTDFLLYGVRRVSLTHFVNGSLPIYAGFQILISEKYKFIYVRQPKSSSSAIIKAIERTFCHLTQRCTREELRMIGTIDPNVWKEYFVFTWVRNPFMRMASAYKFMSRKHMFVRPDDGREPVEQCSIPFLEFTENSNSLRLACETHQCCVYIRRGGFWKSNFIDQHINDQSFGVFTWRGKSMVDFIGRSEHATEDWAQMISVLSARLGVRLRVKPVSVSNGNTTGGTVHIGNDCTQASALEGWNMTVLGNIAKQYAMDLYRFQFTAPAAGVATDAGDM